DYDHFRETVRGFDRDHLDPDLWPEDNAPSGTRIGEALALAAEAHGPDEYRGAQDILLVSDGDDPANDGEWRRGARAAKRRNIPVHVAGVGTPGRPSPIPIEDEFYFHDGDKVWTKLEEKPLQEIA